jgi:hypothetical protein
LTGAGRSPNRKDDVRQLAAEVEASIRGLLALPGLFASLQRLGELGPAIEQIAGFGETLADIARVVPALEQLGELRMTLDALVPTLQSLERSIGRLEGTIGSVSSTLAPLQGTTARVGRAVDRIGGRRGGRSKDDGAR